MILTEEIRLLCNELETPLALSVTMLLALHSISSENTTHIPIKLSVDEVCKSIPTDYCTKYLEQPSISNALDSQTFPFNRHQIGVTCLQQRIPDGVPQKPDFAKRKYH